MLFNSIEYLVFLPIVLLLYWPLSRRQQNLLLLAASYFFYGWWDVRFLFLIAASTVLDYSCGLLLRHGTMTLRERAAAGLWLVLAAFVCLTIQWHTASVQEAFSSGFGWRALGLTVLGLGLLHYLHDRCQGLPTSGKGRLIVSLSVAGNLTILGIFKYYDFFVASAADVLGMSGGEVERYRLGLVLPVGISFYTFQTMSYTIDVYRRRLEPARKFTDFALFVAFFPQLVAGPIERAARLLPQLLSARIFDSSQFLRGIHLILLGLFKKIAIADGVAKVVAQVYGSGTNSTWAEIVVATFLFAIQIYCDFSGYSDIARGTAKLFGIELMVNFRQPYFSKNAREFWQHWHISLSEWLRDYLYIPLGGSHGGVARTRCNLMITMMLGGLWHGAAWNFVLWGIFQGIVVTLGRVTARFWSRPLALSGGSRILSVGLFFGVTCYGWLLFRAESLEQIVAYSRTLLVDFGDLSYHAGRPGIAALLGLPLLLLLELAQHLLNDQHVHRRLPPPLQGLLYAAILFILLIGSNNEPAQFIYFAF